jgi:hypothetical protein
MEDTGTLSVLESATGTWLLSAACPTGAVTGALTGALTGAAPLGSAGST